MEILFGFMNGTIWAMLGMAIAFFVAGMGSSKGVGIAGQTGAGILTENPEKFVPVMVLQALPSTQAIYGFVIAFMIMGKLDMNLTEGQGLMLFAAGLPIGFVGLMSAIYQGKVCASGINMIAKRPEGLVKGIILAVMVEFFAILGLIISLLMVLRVK